MPGAGVVRRWPGGRRIEEINSNGSDQPGAEIEHNSITRSGCYSARSRIRIIGVSRCRSLPFSVHNVEPSSRARFGCSSAIYLDKEVATNDPCQGPQEDSEHPCAVVRIHSD